jgi:hypothetical protein
VHGSLSSAYSAALAGILYGIIYLCAGRIWPVGLGHFLYNIAIGLGITRYITFT